MSAPAVRWALGQTLPTPGAKLLLVVLAEHAAKDGTCSVSQQTLAAESCQSVRSVREHMAALEAAGLVKVADQYRTNKSQKSNQYRLSWGEQPAESAGCNEQISPVGSGNGRISPVGGGEQPAESAPLVPTVLEPTTTTPSVVSPTPNGVDPFEEAWTLFPKRAGGNPRKEARKAWDARLAEGAAPAEMVAGVRRYAAYVRSTEREGTEYVMQARTFFGPGERWRDDYAPPRRTNGNGLHLRPDELRARLPEPVEQGKTRMQIEHEQRLQRRASGA